MTNRLAVTIALALVIAACVPPVRTDRIYPANALAGLTISVVPIGNVAWKLRVMNGRDDTVKLLWDESTYVSTTGLPGRLMNGQTRVMNSDREQPAAVIPPGAALEEMVIPQTMIEWLNHPNAEVPAAHGYARMRLVFEIAGTKETWTAAISFDGAGPPR